LLRLRMTVLRYRVVSPTRQSSCVACLQRSHVLSEVRLYVVYSIPIRGSWNSFNTHESVHDPGTKAVSSNHIQHTSPSRYSLSHRESLQRQITPKTNTSSLSIRPSNIRTPLAKTMHPLCFCIHALFLATTRAKPSVMHSTAAKVSVTR
jgi:hypothetical protein